MFAQLVEAIRYESSQSSSSQPRVKGPGFSLRGRMHPAVGKQAEKRRTSKGRRQQGRRAAEVGDTEFNVGKPGGKKKPEHAKRSYDWTTGTLRFPPSKRAARRLATSGKKRRDL